MSAPAGWYPDPDPSQPPGSVRYWNGSFWTADTQPGTTEFPETRPVAPQTPTQPTQTPQQPSWGPSGGPADWGTGQPDWQTQPHRPGQLNEEGQPYGQPNGQQQNWQPDPAKRSNRVAWIAIGAFALVALMLVAFVIGYLRNRDSVGSTGASQNSNRPRECWALKEYDKSTTIGGSTVSAGGLSFPALPAPWGSPIGNIGMSASNGASGQQFAAATYSGGIWVGSIQVGDAELYDHPDATPKELAPVLRDCLLNSQYGPAGSPAPSSNETSNQALKVDGHDAWTIQSDLTLNVTGLNVKTEQFTLVVVQVAPQRLATYFASVPDTAPTQQTQARALVNELKVG